MWWTCHYDQNQRNTNTNLYEVINIIGYLLPNYQKILRTIEYEKNKIAETCVYFYKNVNYSSYYYKGSGIMEFSQKIKNKINTWLSISSFRYAYQ